MYSHGFDTYLSIQAIPDNITIIEGEKINLKTIIGLNANLVEKNNVIETLAQNQEKTTNTPGKKTVKISLFENIFLKDINEIGRASCRERV